MRRIGYVPGHSFLHKMDPLSKIVMLISFCLIALFSTSLLVMILTILITLGLVGASGMGFMAGMRRIRAITGLCLVLFLLQALFNRSGGPLIGLDLGPLGPLVITTGGITTGARIALRLMIIIVSSLVFVGTTDPSIMAYSLMERGIPYRYGFTLILALRFIPLFQIEANTVRTAQIARGLKIDKPGPRTLLRVARYTLYPLLVSALTRVDQISISMEGRGFGSSRKRTYLRKSHFGRGDLMICSLCCLYVVFVLFIFP